MSGSPSDPFAGHLGWFSSNWVPFDSIRLAADDIGFRLGVTAVERLRTYSGRVFELDAHLDRWEQTVRELGIENLPGRQALRSLVHELIARNADLVRSQRDVGITLFATPGLVGTEDPTLGAHLNRLDFQRIERWRNQGQPLAITDVVQPDPASWSRGIKVRCRLHYFLADRAARHHDAEAVGLLLDQDRTVTETSIANIAILENDRIVSPPAERVLGGITQQLIERLAAAQSIGWDKQPIPIDRLLAAQAILLMGTDPGLWFASRVNGRPLSARQPASLYQELLKRFDQSVGEPPDPS